MASFAAGSQLGPYEILEAIGAGGMGQVYRARDTRLGRAVAIKVLPSEVSGRPEWRERFALEAQTISNLNHPHICVLHDVGSDGGVDYLVMEYLEGETLAARLERGPLPVKDAVRIAVEIGEDQGESVAEIFSKAGLKDIQVVKDYAGLDRVVTAMRST